MNIPYKHIYVVWNGLGGCLWVGRWTGVANETWVVGRCSRLGCRLGEVSIKQCGWCLYSIIILYVCFIRRYRVRIWSVWFRGDTPDASGRVGNHLGVAMRPCSRVDYARF